MADGRAELIADFDLVRVALTSALTYPSREKLGEREYQKAHEDLSKALYSLGRIERVCSRVDLEHQLHEYYK